VPEAAVDTGPREGVGAVGYIEWNSNHRELILNICILKFLGIVKITKCIKF
jgi:hypothetical protein